MKKLTGYPSIDNIHNSDYSFLSRNPIIPNMSIYTTIDLISNFYRKEEAKHKAKKKSKYYDFDNCVNI